MNLVVVILLILVGWLVYNIIQTNINIQKELREIRLKCVKPIESADNVKPIQDTSKENILGFLSNILKKLS